MGGWIPSINEGYRATFGFTSHREDTADGAVLTGDIQYVDHGVIIPNAKGKGNHPMAIHMNITDFYAGEPLSGSCKDNDDAIFHGAAGTDGRLVAYCPQPSTGSDCGLALVVVIDTGNNGASKGDTFSIGLSGGAFGGYRNTGPLGGGNITVGTP